MSYRVYLDLTAGVGGLPLYWTSGGRVRPVVSRIGNKWGYGSALCRVRGLSWRRPPEALLLNDADPEIAGLWRCLLDPEIARAAAARIRSWANEEPRPLWDRLRARLASGKLSPPSVEWASASIWTQTQAYRPGQIESGLYTRTNGAQNVSTTQVANNVGAVAEWVAGYLWTASRAIPATQAVGRACYMTSGDGKRWTPDAPAPQGDALADWAAAWSWVCGNSFRGAHALNARAEEIPVPADARGWLVYADPPYQGTTGYRCEWPRAEVLEVARRWADAGASVMLSEAEPLDLPGWHHVEITSLRRGSKRTFSQQQREWLTLSEPPAWTPPVQRSLFAVGAP